ncbi:unnamed protein product [Bemisia tabaci]|uniref:ZP domain-containing protein n=2 Tax=Bemisia tabaci TaxID=7038 RepID=A0A9P0FZF8_BEMTA|nr:unnamed protein product [Bemisia tabaci]
MERTNVNFCAVILQLCVLAVTVSLIHGKVQYKLRCSDYQMGVDVRKTEEMKSLYLDQLQHYPEPACQPKMSDNIAVFTLSLTNVYQCGVTKVLNKLTGVESYYHKIVVEYKNADVPKEVLNVKCVIGPRQNHTLHRRDLLPAGFQEPEDLQITTSLTQRAPEPVLQVGVRQGGNIINGELNVNPGTPLQMEIYLDKSSAPIYGLLVSYMQVTDTKTQEETIIFNGCSVDPYLFENFNTVDGDFLTAKFRAFKFPESTYVQFKGTVNVCLDKCNGVDCSNGQIGYGRRRRAVSGIPPDPNKIFEVTMTTFIKVDYKTDSLLEKGKLDNGIGLVKPDDGDRVLVNETTGGTASNNTESDKPHHLKIDSEQMREDLLYTLVEERNAACTLVHSSFLVLSSLLLKHVFLN